MKPPKTFSQCTAFLHHTDANRICTYLFTLGEVAQERPSEISESTELLVQSLLFPNLVTQGSAASVGTCPLLT